MEEFRATISAPISKMDQGVYNGAAVIETTVRGRKKSMRSFAIIVVS
jgi:hypothetical protein